MAYSKPAALPRLSNIKNICELFNNDPTKVVRLYCNSYLYTRCEFMLYLIFENRMTWVLKHELQTQFDVAPNCKMMPL